jgi:hypothetical protein
VNESGLFFAESGRNTNLRGPEAERDWKANGSYRSFRHVVSGGGGGRMSSSLSMAGKRARGGVVCCNANFELKIYFEMFAYISSHEDPAICSGIAVRKWDGY